MIQRVSNWSRTAALACFVLTTTAKANTMAPTAQGATTEGEDWNVSTIIPNSYQTYCNWILNGLNSAGFTSANGWNFAFAGFGPAAGIANIPASDFTINYYAAWVVTNDPIPAGITSSNLPTRPIVNQDAGGADFVMTYTPRPGTSDPIAVHFIQAYIETQNGVSTGINATGHLDAPTTAISPYYDLIPRAPTGTIGNSTWMRDIPFTCEKGFAPVNGHVACGTTDDLILSRSDMFQVFVVGADTVDLSASGGSKYTHILYGGEQWGYSYSNSEAPEPSFTLLTGALLLAVARIKRSRTATAMAWRSCGQRQRLRVLRADRTT